MQTRARRATARRGAGRWMEIKVQMWLHLFRIRGQYRALRWWWLGHKPTWLILAQMRWRKGR